MGLFGAVFGLASVAGPPLAVFTDHGSTHFMGYAIAGWLGVLRQFAHWRRLPFLMAFKIPRTNHSWRTSHFLARYF
jgi:predicted alpha/beta hydrolase